MGLQLWLLMTVFLMLCESVPSLIVVRSCCVRFLIVYLFQSNASALKPAQNNSLEVPNSLKDGDCAGKLLKSLCSFCCLN